MAPLIYFESHVDTISVTLINNKLKILKEMGYKAICLEESATDIDKSIANLEFFIQEHEGAIRALVGEEV